MSRWRCVMALVVGCDAVSVDVSPRRDAAAEEVAAPPPLDLDAEVGLGATEPEAPDGADEPCNFRDDDGDGEVDEGTAYEMEAAVDLLENRALGVPIEFRSIARGDDRILGVIQDGFWATNSGLRVFLSDFDGVTRAERRLSPQRHQPSRAFPLWVGGAFTVVGQQRPIGCPTSGACRTFGWRIASDGSELWGGIREAPAVRQDMGGPVVLGDTIWVPFSRGRDDGGEELRAAPLDVGGRWGDEVVLHTVGLGGRFRPVRGVAFDDRIVWVYGTGAHQLEMVAMNAAGTVLARPVVLSPQGQLIEDAPSSVERMGDAMVVLFVVPDRGVMWGRWSLEGARLSGPTLVTRSGARHALAVGHGQVIVVSSTFSDSGLALRRYAPDGRSLQAPTRTSDAGHTHSVVATDQGFVYLAGIYATPGRVVRSRIRCPTR